MKKKKNLEKFLTGFDNQLKVKTVKFAEAQRQWKPEDLAAEFELPKMAMHLENAPMKNDALSELIRGELESIDDAVEQARKMKFDELFEKDPELARSIGFDKDKLMADQSLLFATPEGLEEPSPFLAENFIYGEDIEGQELFKDALEGEMSLEHPTPINDQKVPTFAPDPLPSVATIHDLPEAKKSEVLKNLAAVEQHLKDGPVEMTDLTEKVHGSKTISNMVNMLSDLMVLHKGGKC